MTDSEVDFKLLQAAKNGNIERCRELLSEWGASVNARASDGKTALYSAAFHGHTDLCSYLLSQGASVNLSSKVGASPLHVAACYGRPDVCSVLLSAGAVVNTEDEIGRTPLFCAAFEGHADVCAYLLSTGPSVNLATKEGGTPLHVAAQNGHKDICLALISAGAKVNAESKLMHALFQLLWPTILSGMQRVWKSSFYLSFQNGETPLYLSMTNLHREVSSVLRSAGATTDTRSDEDRLSSAENQKKPNPQKTTTASATTNTDVNRETGETPRHTTRIGRKLRRLFSSSSGPSAPKAWNVDSSLLHAAGDGDLERCKDLLLNWRAAVNAKDLSGYTPLYNAAFAGHLEICTFLLENGADVDLPNEHGATPLHAAAFKGHFNVCIALLRNGASVYSTAKSGGTVVHFAAQNGHGQVCSALISAGAHVNTQDKNGQTPLYWAAEQGMVNVCKFLLAAKASVNLPSNDGMTPAHVAATERHVDVCCVLVLARANMNAEAKNGSTPLSIAAEIGNTELCSVIISGGASLGITKTVGPSPLQLALRHGHDDVCLLLIEEAGRQNAGGQTALHIAAERDLEKVCFQLLERGAPFNVHDQNGQTALHIAASRGGLLSICTLLVEQGASIDARDRHGQTALHLAAKCGEDKVCYFLVEHGASVDVCNSANLTADCLADQQGYNQLARWLRAQKLFGLGAMQPDTTVLRLGGQPGSGKSTVTDTLVTGKLRALLRNESQTDEGDTNPKQRTKGMRLKEFVDEGSTKFVIMDLGGQGQYFMSHQALISVEGMPVINAVVLSAIKKRSEMKFEAGRWASFFACRVRPGTTLQPFLMLATRGERATVQHRANLLQTFQEVSTDFAKYFTFPHQPFLIDARKSWSPEMVELRISLHCLQQEVLNRAASQPSVCEFLQDVLPAVNNLTDKPLVVKEEFRSHIMTVLSTQQRQWRRFDVKVINESMASEVFDASLEYLTRLGKVVAFSKPALKEYVVIKPSWIYTDLVGLIMSDEPLPPPYVKYENGYAKLSDVVELLRRVHGKVSGELALEILSELGFLIIFEDCTLVPFKLTEERREEYWPPTNDLVIGQKMVHAGRRFLFIGVVDMSSALFPLTQCHLYRLFMEQSADKLRLWAGGIRVSSGKYKGAMAIMEAHAHQRCVDIIVCAPEEYATECYQLLHNVTDEFLAMLSEHSPGSEAQRLFLSSFELATLSESGSLSPPKVVYTLEQVRQAIRTSADLDNSDGFPPENPRCLFLSPDECPDLMLSSLRELANRPLDNDMENVPVLTKISALITRRMTCLHLALELDVPEDALALVDARADLDYTTHICRDMLHLWWYDQPEVQRSTHVLYHTLAKVGEVAVAERYEQALLQGEPADEKHSPQIRVLSGKPRIQQLKKAAFLIARCLDDAMDCYELAANLDIPRYSHIFVTLRTAVAGGYKASHAYDMLSTWLQSSPGDEGQKMYGALIEMNKNEIADDSEIKHLLIATVNTEPESCSPSN